MSCRRTRRAIAPALLWIAASCGYTHSLVLPGEARTLGIEVFGNDSLEPDLERPLHLEMTRSAQSLVQAPLESPRDADLVVEGRILSYRRRGGIRTRDNRLLETAVRLEVAASLRDARTGAIVSGPVTIGSDVGYTLDHANGEGDARRRALRNIGDRVLVDLLTQALAGAERSAEILPEGVPAD